MCLYATHTKPKTSSESIKVYKVLKNRYGFLKTPYQEKEVTFINGIAKLKAALDWNKDPYSRIIGACGVHAFIYNLDAILDCRALGGPDIYAVFEAEIPPNTPYWIGVNDDIAATELIIHNRKVY